MLETGQRIQRQYYLNRLLVLYRSTNLYICIHILLISPFLGGIPIEWRYHPVIFCSTPHRSSSIALGQRGASSLWSHDSTDRGGEGVGCCAAVVWDLVEDESCWLLVVSCYLLFFSPPFVVYLIWMVWWICDSKWIIFFTKWIEVEVFGFLMPKMEH